MRYLVLSPFPPATATMLTRLGQRRTSSNSIRNLDSLPPHRYWISSPAGQPPTERREPRLCQVGQPPRVPADRSLSVHTYRGPCWLMLKHACGARTYSVRSPLDALLGGF